MKKILLIVLMAGGCRTGAVAPDVPGEFTFRGLAVHPAAVAALYRSRAGLLDLGAFGTALESTQWEDQPGWWVTYYEEDPASGRQPFFAYAAFAAPLPEGGGPETYVLTVKLNAGEPADVDNILLVRKEGPWLGLIRSWEEGSACRGGIISPRLEGDRFHYARELTPVDLLRLAWGVELDLVAHEDLEDGAESCFAAANYVYSLAEDREDLVSVRLYDERAVDEKGRTDGLRRQPCFNRIFNDYLDRGKTALTPAEVDELAARFKKECVDAGRPLPPPPGPGV